MSVQTNCKGCVFATLNNKSIQEGCSLNRHERLGVGAKEENFILERFCNTYRPQEWLEGLDFQESLDTKATVMDEVSIRMGYILNICEENSEKRVFDALTAIQNASPNWVSIVTADPEWNEFLWGHLVQLFGTDGSVKYHIVQVGKDHAIKTIIDEGFKHAENGWVHILKSKEDMSNLAEQKANLNKAINEQVKQVVMVERSDDLIDHDVCFPAYLFKFLNGNRTKIYNDKNADSRAFSVKIKEAGKRTDCKTIYKWSELDEQTT